MKTQLTKVKYADDILMGIFLQMPEKNIGSQKDLTDFLDKNQDEFSLIKELGNFYYGDYQHIINRLFATFGFLNCIRGKTHAEGRGYELIPEEIQKHKEVVEGYLSLEELSQTKLIANSFSNYLKNN